MYDYFGNRILMSQGDSQGLKAHIIHTVSNKDFFYLKPALLSRRTLNSLHHYTGGRGVFFPTQMPKFMEAQFPQQTKFMRQMMMSAVSKLEFANNRTAEIGTKENGIEGWAMDYVTKITGITRECNLTFPAELDGGFFCFYGMCWLDGILSPRDGVMHMWGFQGAPSVANYSMEGIYFTMDPTEQFVIYSCYVLNMILKEVPSSMFNTTKGEYTHQEVVFPFACMTVDNDKVVSTTAQNFLDSLNNARDHATRLTGNDYPTLTVPQSGSSIV